MSPREQEGGNKAENVVLEKTVGEQPIFARRYRLDVLLPIDTVVPNVFPMQNPKPIRAIGLVQVPKMVTICILGTSRGKTSMSKERRKESRESNFETKTVVGWR